MKQRRTAGEDSLASDNLGRHRLYAQAIEELRMELRLIDEIIGMLGALAQLRANLPMGRQPRS